MAQITNGSVLEYTIAPTAGTKLEDSATPLVWHEIEDVTNIPELIGTTGSIEVTRIKDRAKTYIPGLADNGGNLDFTCHFTPELVAAVDEILAAQVTKEIGFRVRVPLPANLQFFFKGQVAKLTNDAIESEGVLSAKLSIFSSSEADFLSTDSVTDENPFKG